MTITFPNRLTPPQNNTGKVFVSPKFIHIVNGTAHQIDICKPSCIGGEPVLRPGFGLIWNAGPGSGGPVSPSELGVLGRSSYETPYFYSLWKYLGNVYSAPIPDPGDATTWTECSESAPGDAEDVLFSHDNYLYAPKFSGGSRKGEFYSAHALDGGDTGAWGDSGAGTATDDDLYALFGFHPDLDWVYCAYSWAGNITVKRAAVGAGTIGAWSAQTGIAGSTFDAIDTKLVVLGDFIYLIGGTSGFYAPLDGSGVVGTWAELTILPASQFGLSVVHADTIEGGIVLFDRAQSMVVTAFQEPDGTLVDWFATGFPEYGKPGVGGDPRAVYSLAYYGVEGSQVLVGMESGVDPNQYAFESGPTVSQGPGAGAALVQNDVLFALTDVVTDPPENSRNGVAAISLNPTTGEFSGSWANLDNSISALYDDGYSPQFDSILSGGTHQLWLFNKPTTDETPTFNCWRGALSFGPTDLVWADAGTIPGWGVTGENGGMAFCVGDLSGGKFLFASGGSADETGVVWVAPVGASPSWASAGVSSDMPYKRWAHGMFVFGERLFAVNGSRAAGAAPTIWAWINPTTGEVGAARGDDDAGWQSTSGSAFWGHVKLEGPANPVCRVRGNLIAIYGRTGYEATLYQNVIVGLVEGDDPTDIQKWVEFRWQHPSSDISRQPGVAIGPQDILLVANHGFDTGGETYDQTLMAALAFLTG